MTQGLEARDSAVVGGGFIPVFSCAWIVPIAFMYCSFGAADLVDKKMSQPFFVWK